MKDLKITKTEPASVTYGDYGSSEPCVGDWSWRKPATYQVTGPTGRMYTVSGSDSTFMRHSIWHYERAPVFDGEPEYKGGFKTRAACLEAIRKREQATLAAQ